MASDAKTSARKATEAVADKAHEAVDAAAEIAGDAEEHVRKAGAEAAGYPQDLLASVTEYVRAHPLTALGLAFAAGALFSSINRRG
jgi:ElaB/YqjD/DUF883 family membrane-anchored ribosome-binding protein